MALGYVKEMKEVGSGEGKTHGGSAGDSAEVAAPPPEKARAKLWAGKKAAAQPGKRSRKCGRCAPVFLTSLPVPLQELLPLQGLCAILRQASPEAGQVTPCEHLA